MAVFRKVHTSFWSDSFISELDNDHKLFYLYLMTNERTKQCGIYEITKKQISFDLGYSINRVSILLEYFIKKGKIRYNEQTRELALKNWKKYNDSTSPKVKSCIAKEFEQVKDRVLIEYLYSIDTLSQEEKEEEKEEEQEKEESVMAFDKSNYTPSQIESYQIFNNWIDEKAPDVRKIKKQITINEFLTLKANMDADEAFKIKLFKKLISLSNKKGAEKTYRSVYLTLLNWLEND